MDTKSKNIRYSLASKIVAGFILWISIIVALGSSGFLLINSDNINTSTYDETYEYREHIGRLTHNLVEFATKSTNGGEDPLDKNRYNNIDYNLTEAINFNYYIKNLKTNKISYKIPKGLDPEDIKNHPDSIYISSREDLYDLYYYEDIENMLSKSPQDIYILINDPLVAGDKIHEIYENHKFVKTYERYAIAGLIGSLIFFFISFGYLIIVSGRREKDGEIYLTDIDKIYNDIQSLIVLIAGGFSLVILFDTPFGYRSYDTKIILVLSILAIDAVIGMVYLFSMLRQLKKGQLFTNTLIYKILSKIINMARKLYGNLYNNKIFKPWILGIMVIYGLINGFLFKNIYHTFLFGKLTIIAFNGIAVYFLAEKLESLALIMSSAKEISEGNLDYKIDKSKVTKEFEEFAGDIESIQDGLKNAVDKAIKGERMKTDLITNVSHDLKTPLTSIINYVDLLKQEEIDNDNANNYIGILEDKSYRLKQLIEDLIEASKASSGNIIINKEEVNLNELVNQASGEYEDKAQEANLEVRISSEKEKSLIYADGKYMWRIIENLISNAIKYSMPGSRIYIDIEESNGYGRLIVKNMSAYPLDIDPEELTDRFIRADKSRTSEGSGLGLSIAESLTAIQGGKFEIEIDGDLFKVIVEMPLV